MAVGDTHVFPGFLTPVLTQLFFPKPPTTFLTCFCRGERRKYAGKKSRLNRGSNSQPPGLESDTLTTEPPWRGENIIGKEGSASYQHFLVFPQYIQKGLSSGSFNPFPNKPWFFHVCSTSPLKTLREKEKLLVTSNFSFSCSVFYLFGDFSAIFIKVEIVVCKLFQIGRV